MRTPSEPHRALLLGCAAAKITPPPGVALSGFVARTEPMAGVHDDLYARALVWSERQPSPADTVGLVCLDLIGLDPGLVDAIRRRAAQRAGVAPARLAVTATHTHSGPAVMLGARLGVVDQAYRASLIEAAAGAVAAAVGDVQPVRGWYGLAQESTVGKNRRLPGGLIDPDVPVLRFDDARGRVRALLVSYACHPVTLGPDNRLISADYPGYVARTLEAVYPGALAVFLTGCCGQINTGHSAHDSLHQVGLSRRSFAEAERLGRLLAGAALQAAEHAAPPGGEPVAALDAGPAASTVRATRRQINLPLLPAEPPDALRRQAGAWRDRAAELRRSGSTGPALLFETSAAWAEVTAAEGPRSSVPAEVMALTLGEVMLVLLPGEPFVELGLAIKRRARGPVVVVGYANGSPGYLPDRSAYAEGGYEVVEAHRFYGQPAAFAPEASEHLVEAAIELLKPPRA